jgi:hypothetical protein
VCAAVGVRRVCVCATVGVRVCMQIQRDTNARTRARAHTHTHTHTHTGCGHLKEDFAAPPFLCPVDLGKLGVALGPAHVCKSTLYRVSGVGLLGLWDLGLNTIRT